MKTKRILKQARACFLAAALLCTCLMLPQTQASAADDLLAQPFTENFDNFDDGSIINCGSNYTNETGKWMTDKPANMSPQAVDAPGDGDDAGFAGGKAMQFYRGDSKNDNVNMQYLFYGPDEARTSGKIRVTASVRLCADSLFQLCWVGYDGSNAQIYANLLKAGRSYSHKKHQSLGTESVDGGAFPLLEMYAPDTWYDMSAVIDLDNSVYHVSLSKDGQVIAQLRDRMPRAGGTGAALTNFAGIRFTHFNRSAENTSQVIPEGEDYIDNLTVENISQETDEDRVVSQDDFNNLAEASYSATTEGASDKTTLYSNTGWKAYNPTYGTYSVADDPIENADGNGGDKVLVLNGKNSGAGRIVYSTAPGSGVKLTTSSNVTTADNSAKSEGAYNFSFKIYMPEGGRAVIQTRGNETAENTWPLLAYVTDGGVYHTNTSAGTARRIGADIDATKGWVTMDITLDFDSNAISYTLSDTMGHTASAEVDGIPNVSNGSHIDVSQHWYKYFQVRDWAFEGSDRECPLYLDDFMVTTVPQRPRINDTRVTLTDVEGTEAALSDNNIVSPALTQISMKFSCDVDEYSLGGISLSPNADYDLEHDGSNVVLKFSKVLTPDTTYTLTARGVAAAGTGNLMSEAYTGKFATTSVSGTVGRITKIVNASAEGAEVTDINNIKTGDRLMVTAAAANISDSDMQFIPMIAYYKDDLMLAADFGAQPSVLTPSGIASVDAEFAVPAAAAGMTSVRCFMLSGISGLEAYCEPLRIGGEAQEPQYKSEETCAVKYDSEASRVYIGGTLADSKYAVLQVLDQGKSFEGGITKDDVLYQDQAVIAEDGSYFFAPEFPQDDMGYHAAVLVPDKGAERIYLTLVSPEKYNSIYADLNTAAAEGNAETFAQTVNEGRDVLGFDFALTNGKQLSEELGGYMAYVAANPVEADKQEENSKIFNTYMTAYELNKSQLKNIDAYADRLYYSDPKLYERYKELTPDVVIQDYFTAKLSGRDITDLDSFENEFKRALIYTGIRYGAGYGVAREVLTDYGSVLGISGSASNSVYSAMIGKDYENDAALLADYNRLAASASQGGSGSSGGGGGSGGGFGGGSGGYGGFSSGGSTAAEYTMDHLDTQTPAEELTVTFRDIEGVDWASEAILALADMGIINGTAPGLFEPDNPVTREEFAKILVGAMGMSDQSCSGNAFTDVPDGEWYCGYVNIARENGILQGIGGGMFGVGQSITREDMVCMLYNALRLRGVEMSAAELSFEDAPSISDYARDAVGALYGLGAVNGVSETEFDPQGISTRAQAAKIIYSVLNYLQ